MLWGQVSSLDVMGRIKEHIEFLTEVKKIHPNLYDSERNLKKQFSDFKYRPKIKFHGYTECFSELIMEPILKEIA